jgi:hypothetical protein
MPKSKSPKFDTSFHFGANVRPKAAGGGKPRRRRRGGTTLAKSRRFWAGLHGS